MPKDVGYNSSNMSYKVSDSRLKDNTHAEPVKGIATTNAEKYDMGRVKELPMNPQGYPSEAWNYDY